MRSDLEREYVDYVTARMTALRRVAYQLAGDPHWADDIVQQTLTRLYVKWSRARAADNLDAYTHTILVRIFLDERRLRWSRVQLVAEVPERTQAPPPDPEDREVVRAALAQVPPRQRAVLVLRFLADQPVDEVARILRCSEGTVKSRLPFSLTPPSSMRPERVIVITGKPSWEVRVGYGDRDAHGDWPLDILMFPWKAEDGYANMGTPDTTVDGHPARMTTGIGGALGLQVYGVQGLYLEMYCTEPSLVRDGLEPVFRAITLHPDPTSWR